MRGKSLRDLWPKSENLAIDSESLLTMESLAKKPSASRR